MSFVRVRVEVPGSSKVGWPLALVKVSRMHALCASPQTALKAMTVILSCAVACVAMPKTRMAHTAVRCDFMGTTSVCVKESMFSERLLGGRLILRNLAQARENGFRQAVDIGRVDDSGNISRS